MAPDARGSRPEPISIDSETLFSRYAQFVASFLYRQGARGADIEDLVQDVFLTAHRKGGYRAGAASPTTFLAHLALEANLKRRRGESRWQRSQSADASEATVGGGPSSPSDSVRRPRERSTVAGRARRDGARSPRGLHPVRARGRAMRLDRGGPRRPDRDGVLAAPCGAARLPGERDSRRPPRRRGAKATHARREPPASEGVGMTSEPVRLLEGLEASESERSLLRAGRSQAPVAYDVEGGAARFRAQLTALAAAGAVTAGAGASGSGTALRGKALLSKLAFKVVLGLMAGGVFAGAGVVGGMHLARAPGHVDSRPRRDEAGCRRDSPSGLRSVDRAGDSAALHARRTAPPAHAAMPRMSARRPASRREGRMPASRRRAPTLATLSTRHLRSMPRRLPGRAWSRRMPSRRAPCRRSRSPRRCRRRRSRRSS